MHPIANRLSGSEDLAALDERGHNRALELPSSEGRVAALGPESRRVNCPLPAGVEEYYIGRRAFRERPARK